MTRAAAADVAHHDQRHRIAEQRRCNRRHQADPQRRQQHVRIECGAKEMGVMRRGQRQSDRALRRLCQKAVGEQGRGGQQEEEREEQHGGQQLRAGGQLARREQRRPTAKRGGEGDRTDCGRRSGHGRLRSRFACAPPWSKLRKVHATQLAVDRLLPGAYLGRCAVIRKERFACRRDFNRAAACYSCPAPTRALSKRRATCRPMG